MMQSNLRRVTALLAAAVAAVGGLAATGAFASNDGSPAGGDASVAVSAASGSEIAAFPVLGQPANAADSAATPEISSALAAAQPGAGANADLAREVADSPAASAFLVPAEDSVCLVLSRGAGNGSTTCRTDAEATSEGIGVTEDVNDERYSVIGVFPAGAEATNLRTVAEDGGESAVSLSPQDGYAIETATKPVALRWTGAGGETQSRTLFWPQLPVRQSQG